MNPMALVGALVGGVVGVVVWALVVIYLNMEHGLIAWGIGGAVGFGAAALGGRGQPTAIIAALIALASILGGKVASFTHYAGGAEAITEQEFQEWQIDAGLFAVLTSTDEHKKFMVDRGFVDAESPGAVSAEDLEFFRDVQVPILERITDENLDYESFKAATAPSLIEYLKEDFSPIDLLFAFLGIATAYGLVMKAGGGDSIGKPSSQDEPGEEA